ncbi:MAG: hypothetical protein LBS19_13175 [Clostridiales bacterium]|jgi:hypothetical protein|nr:hypothetical protein [Clostridiales bacterium]
MDFIQGLLIFGVIVGVVLIIISFIKKKGEAEPLEDMRAPRAYVLEKKLEAMDTTISEADNVMTELGGMSQNMLKEMDSRYNELLFLYSLIDEKEKGITDTQHTIKEAGPAGNPAVLSAGVTASAPVRPSPVINNPKLAEITEMKSRGMSVSQIAKELNMGQGEVSLILSVGSNATASVGKR